MSGATWFIVVLFEINLGYFCLNIVCSSLHVNSKRKEIIFSTLVSLLMLLTGFILMKLSINSMLIGTFFSSFAAFHMGVIMNKFSLISIGKILDKHYISTGLLSLCGLILLSICTTNEVRLINNMIINPFIFCIAAATGWYFIRFVSILISKTAYIYRGIQYLGLNSLHILCWHLLAFKIVAFVQCTLAGNLSLLGRHPIALDGGLWWIAYTVIGLLVPIAVTELINRIMIFKRNKT